MSILFTLARYLRGHRRTLLLGAASLVVTNALQMAGPWLIKLAVDGLERGIDRSRLAMIAGAILGVAIVGGLFRFWMRRLMIGVSREIEYELRGDFFTRLTGLSFAWFNRTPTGDIMARATNDLNAVRMVLGPGIMYTLNTTITLGAALTLMVVLSWKLTLVALIPMPFISFFMYRYGRTIHRRFEEVQAQFSDITARAQEYLSGVRVVRAYTQEPSAEEDFGRRNTEYRRRYLRLVRIQALLHPVIGFLAGCGSLLVLAYGGIQVIGGSMTLGSFVAFFAYLSMLIWPMIALGWVVSIFQRGAASMKRVRRVLDAEPEVVDPGEGDGTDGEPFRGELEFRDVRYTYAIRPDLPVLRGIDLRIRPGETIGIAGRTGSGKTTLVNLVARLFDPTEGQVLLDGRDLREIPLGRLRRAIGYVPQETFLFSRTISDNIAFGNPEAPEEDRARAAAMARLAGDVEDFPRGYATMVGERGVTLSGGQKQRTAIARALLRAPSILILDDSLSAVDTRTEEEILRELRDFMGERTTILVAHRVSTLKLADRIVMIDDGRIVEEGTHDELLAAGGAYAELARLQQLEEELEEAL